MAVKKSKSVKLVEVKSEVGAGTRGASLGVDAIKIAALDFRSQFFKNNRAMVVPDDNAALYGEVGNRYAKRIKSVLKMYERIGAGVKEVLKDGKFPIVLSGDHSNAAGTIAGIRMAYPDSTVGVIWIDAHAVLPSLGA